MKIFCFFLFLLVGSTLANEDLPSNTATNKEPFQQKTAIQEDASHPKTAMEQIAALPINCTDFRVNCAGNGVCASATECKCDKGYVTFECPPEVQCCYKQESRVTIFLLSFFVGITGAPYFVLGAVGLGVAILVLCVCGTCISSCAGAATASDSSASAGNWSALLVALGMMAALAASIWWIVLWIMVAAGAEFKDTNGVPISGW